MVSDDGETVSFVLSKDEKPLLVWALSRADEDTSEYISSRLVEAPPEFYIRLADIFASIGSQEMAMMREEVDPDRSHEQVIGDFSSIMKKFATAIKEADRAEEISEQLQEERAHFPLDI